MGISKQRRYCAEDDRMVLAEKETPNHLLHLLLTLITAGLWLIIWIFVAIGSDFGKYKCPQCGANTRSRPPKGWKPHSRRSDNAY